MDAFYGLFSFISLVGCILMVIGFRKDFSQLTALQRIGLAVTCIAILIPFVLGFILGFLGI